MKNKISLVFLVVAISVITAFTVSNKDQGYKVGDAATDFELENINGKTV